MLCSWPHGVGSPRAASHVCTTTDWPSPQPASLDQRVQEAGKHVPAPKQDGFPYNLEMPERELDDPREPGGPCPSKGPGAHVHGEYRGVCWQLCGLGGHRTTLGLCFLTWEGDEGAHLS